jgi:predicted Zn-dependent protease
VNITSEWNSNTRFADGGITTSGDTTDTVVTVTLTFGRKRASATTNVLDDASLTQAVDLASRLARLSPDDPELMPELGPQTYASVDGFMDSTAALDGAARAASISRITDAAGKTAGDLFVAGFLDVHARATAVSTSAGLFAYHRATEADLSVTARTPDGTGSGWSHAGASDWSAIDPARIGRIAAETAISSRSPQPLDAGTYTAILQPQAVTDLMPLLAAAFNGRNADEGRSAFSKAGGGNRVGERIADERITLYSDPPDPDLRGTPFDFEGLPAGRRVWIDKGVLGTLAYSRFWAQKQGVQPTPPYFVGGLALAGGTKSTEQLIAECDRGILITHFFYIRSLDPRTVLYTGLTRDGTFLVEKGKIVRSLKNFRWNESPLLMLTRLEDIGRAEPTAVGRMMPALRVRGFNFTALSDAV